MGRRLAKLLSVVTLAVAGVAGPAVADDNEIGRFDQAIVDLRPGVDVQEVADDYGSWVIASIDAHDVHLLGLPEGVSPEDFEELLKEDPRVRDAEVNDDALSPTAVGGETQPFFFQVMRSDFDDQYAPGLLELNTAHAYSTGEGTIVAVIDTGVDFTHNYLAANVLGGWNFVDDDDNVMDEGNGLDDDGDGWADELVGHGTLVAGLVVLVAPDAMIMPVRVLDSDGNSDVFRLTAGVYFAVDNGADVICLGLSTRSHNHILRHAIEYAVEQGTIVLAAAGNDDREHPVTMPGGMDEVIAVAATDIDDIRAGFTNYGDYIGLSAPGVDIVSTIPGNGYGLASGTSLSAAMAAGVAALVRSQSPGASVAAVTETLTSSAVDIDDLNPGYAGLLGAGRVSADVFMSPPGELLNDLLADIERHGASTGGWLGTLGDSELLRVTVSDR